MKRINNVIIKLIVSDFFLNSGWGLIAPIFAIFITQQIEGGSLEVVAFAASIFWITKSIIQPFLANFLDLVKGEKDDFNFLVSGMFLAALVPFGYFFANQIWHVFLLEFIRGIAMACVVPAWYGIFTRHINKGWEAFSWSVQSTTLGFAAGFSAALGGLVATFLGFQVVFLLVCFLKIISASLLLLIKKDLFSPKVSNADLSD
jgi:hypothetical protein